MNKFLFIESRKDEKTMSLQGMKKQTERRNTQREGYSIFWILDYKPLFPPLNCYNCNLYPGKLGLGKAEHGVKRVSESQRCVQKQDRSICPNSCYCILFLKTHYSLFLFLLFLLSLIYLIFLTLYSTSSCFGVLHSSYILLVMSHKNIWNYELPEFNSICISLHPCQG